MKCAQLLAMFPEAGTQACVFAGWLDPAMAAYEINTPERQAAFLAQIAHESNCFKYAREIWGPTQAQKGYEGRHDLGNNQPGDGFRFRGRGLIQITGRANYQDISDALGTDFVSEPTKLESPQYAALSAAWFWQKHGCNEIADGGDFEALTKRINGGLNGFADRCELYACARQALGLPDA